MTHLKEGGKAQNFEAEDTGGNKVQLSDFKGKYLLNFPLIVDFDNKIAKDYGVYGEKSFLGRNYMGITRSTFVIDRKGIIKKIFYKVKVDRHTEEVIEALQK